MSGIVTTSAAVLNQQNDEKSMTKTLPNSPRQFHKSDETESNIKPVIAKAQNDTIIETEKNMREVLGSQRASQKASQEETMIEAQNSL
jgi:hypothetical protein